MISSGTVRRIRAEQGNIRYEYFISVESPETVLLLDEWADQAELDVHHHSPMMQTIMQLREKYDLHMLHMRVKRYDTVSNGSSRDDSRPQDDEQYIRP